MRFLPATFLAIVFGVFILGACNAETGMAGTYYFVSVQAEYDGEMREYGIGDASPSGFVVQKDFCFLHLNSDGSADFTFKTNDEGKTMSVSGTWETLEGEPDTIAITLDNDPLTCECDGSTLVMTLPNNITLTLKK